jgi:hypothetical protein
VRVLYVVLGQETPVVGAERLSYPGGRKENPTVGKLKVSRFRATATLQKAGQAAAAAGSSNSKGARVNLWTSTSTLAT